MAPSKADRWWKLGLYAVVTGALLHAVMAPVAWLLGGGDSDVVWSTLFLVAISLLPYIVAYFILVGALDARPGMCGVLLVLVVDVVAHALVIFAPQSSTDAVALVFVPFWNLLLFLPVGAVAGFVWSRLQPYGA